MRIEGASSTTLGVLCGMGAGALWGLVFLAPERVSGFNPLLLLNHRPLPGLWPHSPGADRPALAQLSADVTRHWLTAFEALALCAHLAGRRVVHFCPSR